MSIERWYCSVLFQTNDPNGQPRTMYLEAYLAMHSARLKEMGISEVRGVIFDVNQPLTTINKGPVNS